MGALMPFKNKENQLYFSHKNDVIASGSVTFMDGINKRSAELFGRFMTENMEAVKSNIMGSEFRFLKYFKSGLYYKWADVSPQKVYRFSVITSYSIHYTKLYEIFDDSLPLGRTTINI